MGDLMSMTMPIEPACRTVSFVSLITLVQPLRYPEADRRMVATAVALSGLNLVNFCVNGGSLAHHSLEGCNALTAWRDNLRLKADKNATMAS